MCFRTDVMAAINLVLCLAILIIGCWGYRKTKKKSLFYLGSAFGIFGVSHMITLMGIQGSHRVAVMLVRLFGYIIVAITLYQMRTEK